MVMVTGAGAAGSQVLEFSIPEKLPTAINSEDEESMPLFSPDGKTLFFTRSMHAGNKGGMYAGQDVWISKWEEGIWRKADNTVYPLNNKDNNAVVGISRDGKTLYLLNASPSRKMKGISFSKKINGIWTAPEDIPLPGIETDGPIGFYVSPDFDVIFVSMQGKDTRGEEDLYVMTKEPSGEWSKPKNLGPTINTPGFEISPFLSQDKKRLYFSSNGHPGLGDADIFYSDRLYDSWETWSTPKNLGKNVNSEKFEAYFSIQQDSICFFSSNRDNVTTEIYLTSILKSKRLELQQTEVKRLIDESKSLLSEIKDVTDKRSASADIELLTYNGRDFSEESKQGISRVAQRMKEDVVLRIAILSSPNPEGRRNATLFMKLIKTEFIKLGIDQSRIAIPPFDDALYSGEFQSKLSVLGENEYWVVILP